MGSSSFLEAHQPPAGLVIELQPQGHDALRGGDLRHVVTDVWGNLLFGAMAGADVPPAYPEILRQLEPIEARFLNALIVSVTRHLPQPGLSLEQMDEVKPLLVDLQWRHLDSGCS